MGKKTQAEVPGDQAEPRLGKQLAAVLAAMSDGAWRTLEELASKVGASELSVSARLRDLRKAKFGAWTVECERFPEGKTYRYKVTRGG